MKMMKQLEFKLYAEALKELGMFNLEKKEIKDRQEAAFEYLRSCHEKEGEKLFFLATQGRARGSFKQQQCIFMLNHCKKVVLKGQWEKWKFSRG